MRESGFMNRLGWMVLAATVLIGACGNDGPARDDQGSIADSGDVSVFTLRVGDCFDDPAGEVTEVDVLTAVPCSAPHDNEVFFAFDLPEGDFPGQDAMVSASADACLGEVFTEYVGIGYVDSVLDVFPINPTEASWAVGDRKVYCALFNIDLSKLTGSARGTAR